MNGQPYTAWHAMVSEPSEMSRTSDVQGILDISDGSSKGSQEQLSWRPLASLRARLTPQKCPIEDAKCNKSSGITA